MKTQAITRSWRRTTAFARRGVQVGLLLLLAPPASAQEVDLSIYSTTDGGGALVVDGSFETRVTPRLPFCPGGICPYSSINPGFITPTQDRAAEGLYALAPGTSVSFVAVAIDDAASVKIGSTVIDAAGESASLGAASVLHVHPEWQAQAPQGEIGTYPVTFTLTTSSPAYADSPPYTMVLSNAAAASPSPTAAPSDTPSPSPTPPPSPSDTATAEPTATVSAPPVDTATTVPSPPPSLSPPPSPTATAACAGDCDGDDGVGVSELITGVNILLGSTAADACRAFDRNGDGAVEVAELIQGVNALLNGCPP
jgi:hypothetical protein